MAVISPSAKVQEAAKYIAEVLADNPNKSLGALLDEAGMRYNLTPLDSSRTARAFLRPSLPARPRSGALQRPGGAFLRPCSSPRDQAEAASASSSPACRWVRIDLKTPAIPAPMPRLCHASASKAVFSVAFVAYYATLPA